MGKTLSLIILILASPLASAIIQNVSVSGASNWSSTNNQTLLNNQSTSGTSTTSSSQQLQINGLTVYGGLAGADCSGGAGATCNSCDPANMQASTTCVDGNGNSIFPLCACNQARVSDNTIVTITITDSISTGRVHLVGNSSTTTPTPATGIGNDMSGSTAGIGFVSAPWGQICGSIAGTSSGGSCGTTSISGTLTLWVDNNVGNPGYEGQYNQPGAPNANDTLQVTFTTLIPTAAEAVYDSVNAAEGVGQFTAFPGDTRIYMINIGTPGSFPTLTGESSLATAMHIMASTSNINRSVAGMADNQGDSPVNGSDFSNLYLDGVQNDVGYYVRVAMKDQANNLLQYYPNNTVPLGCTGGADPLTGAASNSNTPVPANACTDFYVIPDQVLGILDKDLNCFVATAAYGSSLEPKINVFREFRKQILFKSRIGRLFVMDYYKYGPYAARFIFDKPVFRLAARTLLWPLWGFSTIAVSYGLPAAAAVSLALMSAFAALVVFTRRRLIRD